MSQEGSHEALLREVLEQIVQNNRAQKPGTPLAELKSALEVAIRDLPPLDFAEFDQAVGDADAVERLLRRAPEIIGWDADQVVEWMEELAGKL